MNQTTDTSPILTVENLSLRISQTDILSGVNFEVKVGQFVGLLGPNGAGKSSLLRCIYRYCAPTDGRIMLFGKPIDTYSRQEYAKHVAVVLQEVPEQFNLAVFDVIAMGLTPHKPLFSSTSKEDKSNIEAVLDRVGLLHKAKQVFSSLSGGEKQRAMIARAMLQKPSLLIMDEPTSHLDVRYQIQIMELAKSLGVCVLASFHDLNLAGAMSDHLLVLKNGQLQAQGEPNTVLSSGLLSDVFGVCADVSHVPIANDDQTMVPHIRYHYGYVR
ncbi:ABC transporter ATP-binding protein [Pseudoalteromonas sp. JBTF-M23]|uniref:ABC transporter ATP-binding protein n=1 Tax=Pseudoalteromonas caenipelagi TaxID=2726988 RepID=A0A849VI13_9GAMM|nr:ABC transporter ATP-binding protein [Pseudoalteromonas caenipelagi]NOU52113.1 ABC transporter ATP-binding protein [Pseudoalteromonas caenipelagi]